MLPETMHAVLLTGHGGFDKLKYRDDVPVPRPAAGEVLIRIGAAGVNNTDINTRVGWYSKAVHGATDDSAAGATGSDDDASWGGSALQLPRIQGIDVCGRIVAVGAGVEAARIGQRVLVSPCLREPGSGIAAARFFGSECDGGFAQYCVAPSHDSLAIDSALDDIELASFPCAYSTAENMLHRARLAAGERVLITGASGGVGSAAVQLARRRGAEVIAVAGAAKHAEVAALGAAELLDRGADPLAALGADSVDVVVDLVAGTGWPRLLEVLRRGGRYAVAGAIAGPLVELDLRTLYLKDLTLFGCTVQDELVFENLISYIERGEIRPLVARHYPLADIVAAQRDFLAKTYTGKLVLVPPAD